VINFGKVSFAPGAYNIVPERVELALDFRAPEHGRMEQLESAVLQIAGECARRYDLEFERGHRVALQPTPCADECRQAFVAACEHLDLTQMPLASGAGHDTMALASVCPAGMIFIPSTGGSHSPREFAEWDACVHGANVLLLAALDLARRPR